MIPPGAVPYTPYGWVRPADVESERPRDDDMPVVLVAGRGPDDLREVHHVLTRTWRRVGRPIVVAVSVWDWPVGREAQAWASEHAVCGIRFQRCVTAPARVDEVLAFGPVRLPAARWIPTRKAAA